MSALVISFAVALGALTTWIERLGLDEEGQTEIGGRPFTAFAGEDGRAYVWAEAGLSGAVLTDPTGDESARRLLSALR